MNPYDAVKKSSIKCDSCDWEKEVDWQEVKDWHNKPCPECGKSPIISDEDLQMFQAIEGLLNVQASLHPNGIEDDPRAQTVRINTAPLRDKPTNKQG